MSLTMLYSTLATITSLLIGIGLLIYVLIRSIVRAHRRHREAALRRSVDIAKSELWADASAKSLQLNMAATDARNRMDAVFSEYKDEDF